MKQIPSICRLIKTVNGKDVMAYPHSWAKVYKLVADMDDDEVRMDCLAEKCPEDLEYLKENTLKHRLAFYAR
jgi:hypothetical protein